MIRTTLADKIAKAVAQDAAEKWMAKFAHSCGMSVEKLLEAGRHHVATCGDTAADGYAVACMKSDLAEFWRNYAVIVDGVVPSGVTNPLRDLRQKSKAERSLFLDSFSARKDERPLCRKSLLLRGINKELSSVWMEQFAHEMMLKQSILLRIGSRWLEQRIPFTLSGSEAERQAQFACEHAECFWRHYGVLTNRTVRYPDDQESPFKMFKAETKAVNS